MDERVLAWLYLVRRETVSIVMAVFMEWIEDDFIPHHFYTVVATVL